jgi:hypothetical protein
MILKISKILLLAILFTSINFAKDIESQVDSSKSITEPNIFFGWKWGVSQLIPSPEWITTGGKAKFGMRWQVTPLLYSFGMNKKLSPWRCFLADPLSRQSGSVEIFVTPEYLNIEEKFKDKWLFRSGVRFYIPIWQKGEYASLSFAASYYNFNGENGFSYEGGFYLFAGILGIQTTYSPSFTNSEWIFTIRLRYF